MSDFQSTLNDVMSEKNDEPVSPLKNKRRLFSFKFFFVGLFLLSLFFASAIIWASFKYETDLTIVDMPSKTAIVAPASSFQRQVTTLTIQPEVIPADIQKQGIESEVLAPPPDKKQPIETITAPKEVIKQDSFTPQESTITKPKLSFIITDLGISPAKTKEIIQKFDKSISLSMSPYSSQLDSLITLAKKDGHEIYVTLTLETRGYPLNDGGPLTLMVSSSTTKNLQRLDALLKKSKDIKGFVAQKDHIFKAEDANINPAINKIFNEGFAIIDSEPKDKSFLKTLAARRNYPFAQNTLWLDDILTPAAIERNILAISEYAELNKDIIIMLRPYPNSIKALEEFLKSDKVKTFDLVPASSQLNQ